MENLNIYSQEKLFYNWIIQNPNYFESVSKEFFNDKNIQILYNIALKFYQRFSKSPSKEQMKTLIDNSKKAAQEGINYDIVNQIYNIDLNQYNKDWLKRTFNPWVQWRNFENTLFDIQYYIENTKISPDNAEAIIEEVKTMFNNRTSMRLESDLGLDFFNPESHVLEESAKIQSPWKYINSMNGGYDAASLVTYIGMPNVGKSIYLANEAVNFMMAGYNTAMITAEMSAQKFIKRMGANILNVKVSKYDDWVKNNPDMLKNKLASIKRGMLHDPGYLYTKKYPTSSTSVPEIENYLTNVEKTLNVKFQCVVIDYINLLYNFRNPNTENTYLKIKQIAEDLRAMADRNNWLIVTATQITKSGYNNTDLQMSDIAESQGLSQTADMILGIIQDESMHADNYYYLKMIKNRDGSGKNERFQVNVNYDYMRLTEDLAA